MNERTRSRPSRADRPGSVDRPLRASRRRRHHHRHRAPCCVVGLIVLAEPARVGHLTVTNSSEYDVGIELTSGESGTWLPFAVVGQRSTREFQDVLDQGDTWVFALPLPGPRRWRDHAHPRRPRGSRLEGRRARRP